MMVRWWDLLLFATGLLQSGGHTRVLLITGLSATPKYAAMFAAQADSLYDAAHTRWGVGDSDLVYLAEDPATDTARITARSTRANVEAAFATLARRVQPGDVVLVFLRGHGSGAMETSAVNLPGPDPTAVDYAAWIAPLHAATVIFVNASSASGDFAPVLAGPGRVVITATRTAMERNESIFAGYFVAALTGSSADANKDGRVSIAEAFAFARDQVARAYDDSKRLQTEHAVMIDSSHVADRVAFGGAAASVDPRVIALVGQRRQLEAAIDSLRLRKPTMDSTTYDGALEALLLQLAGKSRLIDSLLGTKP
jgi:hypothetical protein